MSWSPDIYGRFRSARFRPALDLLNRIDLDSARTIADLGCGTGDVTALLAARWPEAQVTGVDSSAAMLDTARAAYPAISWAEADIASWRPAGKLDVIYSNAALHWLDDHQTLLLRLAGAVAPGGVLAVQMPDNFEAPSHQVIREIAERTGAARMLAGRPARPVHDPEVYDAMLSPHVQSLDIWRTEYLHRLEGPDAVFRWVQGSALTPYARLPEAERADFHNACRVALAAAYPQNSRGETLFSFRRIFIVASV